VVFCDAAGEWADEAIACAGSRRGTAPLSTHEGAEGVHQSAGFDQLWCGFLDHGHALRAGESVMLDREQAHNGSRSGGSSAHVRTSLACPISIVLASGLTFTVAAALPLLAAVLVPLAGC
jgi:VIT1/CCC1 family predicted Fe2+/Mn2+ transporter